MFKLRKNALIFDTVFNEWGVITSPVSKKHNKVIIRYQKRKWTTLYYYSPERFEVWG